ncbi:MAG: hypothetical protein WDZ35_00330 [Crocinitomicaceae bacterium]
MKKAFTQTLLAICLGGLTLEVYLLLGWEKYVSNWMDVAFLFLFLIGSYFTIKKLR